MLNRTLDAVGYDVTMDPLGDLRLDPYGSLEKVTGTDCIVKALIRRLSTPPAGYCRLIRSAGEYLETDYDYQNPLYNYLSSPTTQFNDSSLLEFVRTAASFDPRIEPLEITDVVIDNTTSTVKFNLRYRILSNEVLQSQMSLPLGLAL